MVSSYTPATAAPPSPAAARRSLERPEPAPLPPLLSPQRALPILLLSRRRRRRRRHRNRHRYRHRRDATRRQPCPTDTRTPLATQPSSPRGASRDVSIDDSFRSFRDACSYFLVARETAPGVALRCCDVIFRDALFATRWTRKLREILDRKIRRLLDNEICCPPGTGVHAPERSPPLPRTGKAYKGQRLHANVSIIMATFVPLSPSSLPSPGLCRPLSVARRSARSPSPFLLHPPPRGLSVAFRFTSTRA